MMPLSIITFLIVILSPKTVFAAPSPVAISSGFSQINLSQNQIEAYIVDQVTDNKDYFSILRANSWTFNRSLQKEAYSMAERAFYKANPHLDFKFIFPKRDQLFTSIDKLPKNTFLWYRFVIKPSKDIQSPINLYIRYGKMTRIARLHTYSQSKGTTFWGNQRSIYSTLYPSHDEPRLFHKIQIQPGEITEVYLAYQSVTPGAPKISILNEVNFREQSFNYNLLVISVLSAILISALMNIFLLFMTKDNVYLFITLFSFATILLILADSKILRLTTIHSIGGIHLYNFYFFGSIFGLVVFFGLFAIEYLELPKESKIRKSLLALINIHIALALTLIPMDLLGFIGVNIYPWVFFTVTIAAILTLGISSIYLSLKGNHHAKILIVSSIYTFAGAIIIQLSHRGILSENVFTANSLYIGVTSTVIFLSMILGDKIRALNEDLKRHISHVESIVDDKTRQITSILEHIQQGIFTLTTPAGNYGEHYSSNLLSIFETKDIKSHRFFDDFIKRTNLPEDHILQLKSVLNSIGEEKINFQLNQHLLPKDLEILRQSGAKQILELEWIPIVDNIGLTEKILVCVRDMTKARELEKKSQQVSQHMQMVQEIIAVDTHLFQLFIRFSLDHIEQNRRLIEKHTSFDPSVLLPIFINIHTIKGSARCYNFQEVVNICHNIEQTFAQIRNGQAEWNQAELLDELKKLSDIIDQYRHIGFEQLGRSNGDKPIELDVEFARHLLVLLKANSQAYQNLEDKVKKTHYTSLRDLLDKVFEALPSLSKNLGKEIPNINYNGKVFLLDPDGAELVRSIFVHVIRNTMDHGIENSSTRAASGKNTRGTISLNFELRENFLEVFYHDDGRGLNLDAIKQKAIDRDIIQENDVLSKQQLAELIINPSLTTAESISEISGRGIGMSAIHNYLQDVGGCLEIILDPDNTSLDRCKFTLLIKIPKKFIFSSQLKVA